MAFDNFYDSDDFQRNMRKTPFLKLLPHWFSENDELVTAIGAEVERIKAQAIFALLNAGIKPPVMIWQESLVNEQYTANFHLTKLPSTMNIQAPLYKTWGKIILTNNTVDDIDGLEITFDDKNGYMINQLISQNDKLIIDLTNQKVTLNNHTIKVQELGDGMPYFITSQNKEKYDVKTPLHNEVVRIKVNTDTNLEDTTVTKTINVTENLDNWTNNGNAYLYNPKGADPWIALQNDANLGYELNFDEIDEITFWYKGTTPEGKLECYCGEDKLIFSKDVTTTWTNYSIDTSELQSNRLLLFKTHDTKDDVYINEIKYKTTSSYNIACDIDVDVEMDNAVFTNEQNIEVTGLELIPIERIELYANYDFDYNPDYNGWRKVYQKKYEEKTNVIYDMVTTHFYTKEFYVDVWFKTLQYPYRVGFPAYQDAETDSMYHVNNRLDTWGEQLGLERRLYKKEIKEEDYPYTFPEYYPFDIEQDFWYYSRLINEYTWNDLAINDVDLQDINGDNILRLYSINPFCEDFVVHAKSIYPSYAETKDCSKYSPRLITQQNTEGLTQQTEYNDIINLLVDNKRSASITLNNNSNNNDVIYKKESSRYIENNTNTSKELITYFDLSDLPEDINIDNIEVIVEGESTDNKIDKNTTTETGLLVPTLESDENIFVPLTPDNTYQLKKRSIIFSNDDINTYLKDFSDENVFQEAIIGTFECRIGKEVKIPFTLKENTEEVTDISKVYLYFDDVLMNGEIIKEDNEQYIKCIVPRTSYNKQITIIVKSKTKHPFTTIIDTNRHNHYIYLDKTTKREAILHEYTDEVTGEFISEYLDKETEEVVDKENVDKYVDYRYITGPIIDGAISNAQIIDEWHTGDLRNLIQREGIYFRHILQNDNEQSSTTVLLYNITLKICYSPKKTTFNLNTHVNIKDRLLPHLGTFEVEITNTGAKSLKTTIDIFNPPNITLETNTIDVDLNRHESIKKYIPIKAEYPLIDGFYEILTTCEDVIRRNSISVFSDGLIGTSVTIKPHHGKYYEDIKLKAEVKTIDGSKINGGVNQVQFYINNYAVGDPVLVKNNIAETTIVPGYYNFTGTGTLKLEARYLGSTKYATSRGQSTIFIGKNSTRITIDIPKQAIYKTGCEVRARVEYFNGEEYFPVTDGAVTFILESKKTKETEILGISNTNDEETFKDGNFVTVIESLDNPVGDYILHAKYDSSVQYAGNEASQEFEIIGGSVKIRGFDETIKPNDQVQLKAKVLDTYNRPIPYGYVDFLITGINDVVFNKEIKNVPVKDGLAVSDYETINIEVNDGETAKLKVIATYHGTEDGIYSNDDSNADNPSFIFVKKSEVYFEYPSLYRGSQYEPLGFIVKVFDATTNEAVTNGTITIRLPQQNNVYASNIINSDGIARIIYLPVTFSAKEWSELNKFSFTTAGDNTRNIIDIVKTDFVPTEPDFNKYEDYLFKVYDGEESDLYNTNGENIGLVNFTYENGQLYIIGTGDDGREIKEHVYIDKDGYLYARSTFDDLRTYNLGIQNIEIDFNDTTGKYVSKTVLLEDILNITESSVDLDIHSYDLFYTDDDEITCYVTEYSHSLDKEFYQENTPSVLIDEGKVEFLLDDTHIQTYDVLSGKSILSNDELTVIGAGNHLMAVKYYNKDETVPVTQSYSFLNLKKTQPTIDVYNYSRIIKGHKCIFFAIVQYPTNVDIPLNGVVNFYMDGEAVDTQYLYGNELLSGIVGNEDYNYFNIEVNDNKHIIHFDNGTEIVLDNNVAGAQFVCTIPDDIDINEHIFSAEYLGNEYFESAISNDLIIKQEQTVAFLSTELNEDKELCLAVDEEAEIEIDVSIFDPEKEYTEEQLRQLGSDDVINEGQVALYIDTHTEVAKAQVANNKATLKWTPTNKSINNLIIKYINGQNYIDVSEDSDRLTIIKVNIEDPQDEITLPSSKYPSIQNALMSIKTGGTIYLDNGKPEKDTEIIIKKTLNIYKDCNIIGTNNSSIIKDVDDLVTDLESIYMYNIENLDIDNLYEIEGLSVSNLNKKDFYIDDDRLFFRNQGLHTEIFLADDNKFYSEAKLTLDNINTDVNINIGENAQVHINNIKFASNDNTLVTDFVIHNDGYLVINHSILTKEVVLENSGTLMAQRNLMYCKCLGGGDLNNNWWGSNIAPYDVDNHIIIEVNAVDTPAVISEEVDIVGQVIGANGRTYDIPSMPFAFSSDSGYFSISSGVLTDNKAKTTFLDAEKEGNIYFTVDNETASCMVYNYERKTEVIIDEITETPINYQATISAKVQSCADTYYVFDKNNNIVDSTKLINEGYISFYIDDKQVGYSRVKDGEASTTIFFTEQSYKVGKIYELKAIYEPADYYFSSTSVSNITLFKEDDGYACFVSPQNGSDTNNGLYHSPVQTIQKAIDLNTDIIYLLDGNYTETGINVTNSSVIKAYNTVTFSNLQADNLFNIPANKSLNIQKINLINNQINKLFNNQGRVDALKCVFRDNTGVIYDGSVGMQYCAVLDENISENIGNELQYCWFGTNTPRTIDSKINNYIIMTVESSKDNIYIGTLAHITALLTHYKQHSGIKEYIYPLNEKLPLRIAHFATDYGSFKPVKDYTYSNKSVSLFNTNEDNNTIQYILELPENKNYIRQQATIICNITDVFGNSITSKYDNVTQLPIDIVKMHIYNDSTDITKNEAVINGVAKTTINKLPIGKYNIDCNYIKDNQVYSASGSFVVQKPEIIVTNFNMSDDDNLYNTIINATLQDNFSNNIHNEVINISIDGERIGTYATDNGLLQKNLTYPMIAAGEHILTLDNKDNNSSYEEFEYNHSFISTEKETQILFNYTKLEAKINNNLFIEVKDNNRNYVTGGTISIDIDNQTIASEVPVNGTINISNVKIDDIGQHNIIIYYSGLAGYYEEQVYVNNQLGVGIFEVDFNLDDILTADIGYDFTLSTTVTDVGHQLVNQGYINLYIDNILFNKEPIYINSGVLEFTSALPVNIATGKHAFTIEYIDSTDTYLDTYLNTYLIIGKIATEISMNYVYGSPGQRAEVDYNISTAYGNANAGILTAKYDGIIIGQSYVTDSFMNQITITTPFLPATDEYEILFEYHDDTDTYADSTYTNTLVMQKNEVNIEPSHTWYYPNQPFHFSAYFTDKDNNIINTGKAALYIDNVKESESIDVVNGQITLDLTLAKARTYNMTIIYEDNDYYAQTPYNFKFKVDSVNIDDILFDEVVNGTEKTYYLEDGLPHSYPNQLFKANLKYQTLDNYNVKDGILDILIDNTKINSYYVAESNKYIEFNIRDLDKGNHTLTFNYHDSGLFNDFTKEYILTIESQKVTLSIDNIIQDGKEKIITYANNDIIKINTVLDKEINGILQYYIGLPVYRADEVGNTYTWKYDYKFIGLEQINQRTNVLYEYDLPDSLLEYSNTKEETNYVIKVEFPGNNQYNATEKEVFLEIKKDDCEIKFNKEEYIVNYRQQLIGSFTIDAFGEQYVTLQIQDNDTNEIYNIGSVITQQTDNGGVGEFIYQMSSKFATNINGYQLIASFNGSAINQPCIALSKITVQAAKPQLQTTDIEAYIGGELTLDNILILPINDNDYLVIEDGKLSYKILYDTDKEYVINKEYTPNQKATVHLPADIIKDAKLEVTYTSEDTTRYMSFTEEVDLVLNKNDIILKVVLPDEVYKREDCNIKVEAYSKTTKAPVDVSSFIYLDEE